MIELVFAQARLAASLALGLPFSLRGLNHIIDGLKATRREFGPLDIHALAALQAPALDPQALHEVHLRRFRAQSSRAARETAYYRHLFAAHSLDPARLRWDDILPLPLTPKQALRDDPTAFVRSSAQPILHSTTTGTTGRPTSVYFSAHEMQTYIALGAISHLLSGEIAAEDQVLLATSTRATLGNTCFAGSCARVGALLTIGGIIDPLHSLALLAQERRIAGKKPRASVLLIYPSYLGELVEAGLSQGYRPTDFSLERILLGGEIVTAGLKTRCQELFGPLRISESYGMTETWPCTGSICPEGHLHFEPSTGLVEVCDPQTGLPTPPGGVGTLVVTPFPPYRETTLVLRYDTEDLVQTLSATPACALGHLPAVGAPLGKRALAVPSADGWVSAREVLEALEALEVVPLPARCGFWAVAGGVAVEVMVRDAGPASRRQVGEALEARGIPLRTLRLYHDLRELHHPLSLRCDLKEASFQTGDRSAREIRLPHAALQPTEVAAI